MHFRGPQPVVEAFINDQGPFPLAIDTAGGGTALFYKSFADGINLPDAGRTNASDGSGSRSVAFRLAAVDSIRIGEASFTDMDCAVRDTPADTTTDGRPLAGVLGIRCFDTCLLTLDFPGRTVTIESGELPAPDGKTVLALDPGQEIPCLLEIRVGDRTLPARIDSGNLGSVRLPYAMREEVPLGPRAAGAGRSIVGEYEMIEARLRTALHVGSFELQTPLVHFVPQFDTANLGSEALKHFAVTVDMRNRRMRLTRSETGPIPVEHVYRVGLRMAATDGGVRIDEVTAGGAADQAGLKAGDLILTMNDLAAAELTDRERRALCSKPAPIRLLVRRETQQMEFTITPARVGE